MHKKDKIYEILRQQIISLTLTPGANLIEEELGKRFQVSRTIIREILRKLNHNGLVDIVPNKGASVSRIELSDVREIIQIRLQLETLAAKIATPRFSKDEIDEFDSGLDINNLEKADKSGKRLHAAILRKCENKRLENIINSLTDQIERMYKLTISIADAEKKVLYEHRNILEAIKKGDGDLAEMAMREHIENTRMEIINLIIGKMQ